MLLPYGVDVPMERWPWANWALIACTSIISISIWTYAEDYNRPLRDSRVPELALQPGHLTALQLVSYLFVHADLAHLLGNMFFLFVFGNAVNAKLGHPLFLASYVACGVIAGLAWLLLGNGMPVVGASGAIMGVVGFFLVLFPRNDITIFYWIGWVITGTFTVAAGWLILFYLACDLLGVLIAGRGAVAYVAHLGGAAAGVAAAVAMVANDMLQPTDYEENLLQTLGLREKHDRYERR